MPRRRYALERGGPKTLAVEWGRGTDVAVSLDGSVLGSFAAARLDAGAAVPLPDGTTLFLQRMPRCWWSLELREPLRAERLGAPVPGSDWDPRTAGRRAASVIALFGLLIGGVVALWGAFSSTLLPVAIGAAVAAVFLVLAALAASGRRAAVAVVAVLLVAQVAHSLAAGAPPSAVGLVFRAIFVAELVRAWSRMGATPMRPGGAPAAD